MSDLEQELRRHVEGDVRFDQFSRLLYSTDASMYQMEPMGVVIPRHAGDVQAVVEVANRMGAPILSRGGGTSLTGQTVNHAVVIDFSRYMNQVLEVNTEELWARVRARSGAGRAEPARAIERAPLRARHVHLEPRHHRRHARQ